MLKLHFPFSSAPHAPLFPQNYYNNQQVNPTYNWQHYTKTTAKVSFEKTVSSGWGWGVSLLGAGSGFSLPSIPLCKEDASGWGAPARHLAARK